MLRTMTLKLTTQHPGLIVRLSLIFITLPLGINWVKSANGVKSEFPIINVMTLKLET